MSALIDPQGNPLVPARRARADSGFDRAFRAMPQNGSPSLSAWFPRLQSEDGAYLRRRDETVARIRDLEAENGLLSGAMQRAVDETIGANFFLNWRPDLATLGLDREWGRENIPKVERAFRNFCSDPRRPLDAAGKLDLAGMLGLAFRHRVKDGEAIGLPLWLPNRGLPQGTAVQMISPDRLSNPQGASDTATLRGGVELDAFGRPLAYHFRGAHPTDKWGGVEASVWTRVPARMPSGRPRVLHFFEATGADQTRGRGFFAPALEKMKLGDVYERTELEAALINAVFAAFIESPFDKGLMDDATDLDEGVSKYQEQRADFADSSPVMLRGARIARLFPGERMNLTTAGRANMAFASFVENVLRSAAAAMGQSYEQFANDWSKTNYSSARASMLGAWKFLVARRTFFAAGFASPIFGLWLEEELETGRIEVPDGTPKFWDAPAAWTRGVWVGPGRGWVDPVKEAQAAAIRMETGLSTLQDEAAEQGRDYLEILDQRNREIDDLDERGLALNATAYDDVSGQPSENPDARPGDPQQPENAPLAARILRLERIRDRAAARAQGRAA